MSIVARDAMRELQRQQVKKLRDSLRDADPMELAVRGMLRELLTMHGYLLDELERIDSVLRSMERLGGP